MTVFTIAHLKNHECCALRVLFTSSIYDILARFFSNLKHRLLFKGKAVRRKERPKLLPLFSPSTKKLTTPQPHPIPAQLKDQKSCIFTHSTGTPKVFHQEN